MHERLVGQLISQHSQREAVYNCISFREIPEADAKRTSGYVGHIFRGEHWKPKQ